MLQPVLDRIVDRMRRKSFAGDPRWQRCRLRRARQPDAGVFRRHRYRLPAAGVLHLGRPRNARPTIEMIELDPALKRSTEPVTPFTVTDKKLLPATIMTDRAQGYSLVDREAEPGFRSISVPVRRYDGTIVAAINMGAHVDRVSGRK